MLNFAPKLKIITQRPAYAIKKGEKLLVFITQNLRPEAFDPWQSSSRR